MIDVSLSSRRSTTAIVIHSALTYPGQQVNGKIIRAWHMARGYSDIGYHFVCRDDGVVEVGRRLDAVGAHTIGRNADSVGIVLAGGLRRLHPDEPRDRPFVEAAVGYPNTAIAAEFPAVQLIATRALVRSLLVIYPGAAVEGHRDAARDGRTCPCFNAPEWFAAGMPPRAITSLP